MNLLELPAASAALAGVCNVLLGLVVWLKTPNRRLAKTWALFSLSLAIWSIGFSLVFTSASPGTALAWARIRELGLFFIPATFLHVAYAFSGPDPHRRARWLLAAAYVGAASLALTAFTPYFVRHVVRVSGGFLIVPGAAGYFTSAYYVGTLSVAVHQLVKSFRARAGHQRRQMGYVLAATLVGFGIGFTNFLPVYGLVFSPIAYVANILSSSIVVYAIIARRLLDIEIAIRRGVVYSTITAVFAGTYLGVLHVTGQRIEAWTGLRSVWPPMVAIIALAVAFEPIRNGLQSAVDRVFFKTKYEYQDEISKFSQMVVTILDLDILLNRTVNTVKDILKLDRALLLLYSHADKSYQVAAFSGVDESVAHAVSFGERSRFVTNLKRESQNIALEVDAGPAGAITAISLFIKNDLIGFLILGEKMSGDPYSRGDLDLLTTLANQLSVAIENARLYRAAVTDELTKLFDQAYFYRRLDEELARSKGHRTSLSLIMVDLDKFSSFARSHGRAASNRALVSVGRLVREAARPFDVPARVGEDEFAIILPGMRKEEVTLVAARLRKRINSIKVGKEATRLSASTGYACTVAGKKKKEALTNEARLSLFEAREKKLSELP